MPIRGPMFVRLVTTFVAAALLTGCSTEEGVRAQELLRQAEAAQKGLSSATFDGSMAVSVDGMNVRMLFDGATTPQGEWFSLRTNGVPNGGDMALQILVRDGRTWMHMGEGWQATGAAPTGAQGTVSADAFQQLAQYVTNVRVSEHQMIDGRLATTIAGAIDTQAMMDAFSKLSSFAPGGSGSFDFSDAGVEFGDIHAVMTIDERTNLLDTAFISFSMSVQGKTAEIEVRYRLASANEPVELPQP